MIQKKLQRQARCFLFLWALSHAPNPSPFVAELPHLLAVAAPCQFLTASKSGQRLRQMSMSTRWHWHLQRPRIAVASSLCKAPRSGHWRKRPSFRYAQHAWRELPQHAAGALTESSRGAAGCSDALSKIVRSHFRTTVPQKTTKAKKNIYIDLERCLSHTAGLDEDCYHFPRNCSVSL